MNNAAHTSSLVVVPPGREVQPGPWRAISHRCLPGAEHGINPRVKLSIRPARLLKIREDALAFFDVSLHFEVSAPRFRGSQLVL
ncbi:hypothetical protein CHELA1G11_13047 [Hyphomicrobiales bacterium]|nr:hypothetical protein CHELA1G2_11262 [Hyphomicrobiales bacterium]CAH1668933.1 hypothetical protein CHELA1G11_13047 [Hyphomicrobiales bacterium]